MIHARPELAAILLGEAASDYDKAVVSSNDLSDCPPTEYRADAVVLLEKDGVNVHAIVVENQLREEKSKRFSWPAYAVNLRATAKCPSDVLVLCPDNATANWCAQPITLGRSGSLFFPIAVGPAQVPRVTDPQEARENPELAAFSAISHGGPSETGTRIFESWLASLENLKGNRGHLYFDYVISALSEIAHKHLETLMNTGTYEYQSDFAKKYYGDGVAEGEAKGEAKAILTFLATRGISVSPAVRDRIQGCTDTEQLTKWVSKAVTVETAEELFKP